MIILYLSAFLKGIKKFGKREILIFCVGIIPFILLIAFVFPIGFVDHDAVLNNLYEDINPNLTPIDEVGRGFPDGRMQAEQGRGKLEGLRPDMWFSGRRGSQNKQYAVMVIASQSDPIYAAESYFGKFDSIKGLMLYEDEDLNELRSLHLLDTWKNFILVDDDKRYEQDIFYLSTINTRAIAYRPYSLEPTILHREYFPFKYSYHTVSELSESNKEDWQEIQGLSIEDRAQYSVYLEVALEYNTYNRFKNYLDTLINQEMGYYQKIEALLKSFSSYQYMLGFDDNVGVEKIGNFLFDYKEGDCTEFSNSLAILARLAGIPSRIVVGYLAAKDLRTVNHFKGLYFLQQKIEPLQEFTLEELYLVTTAHRHSWVQLYMPGYGWIDFEATMFAIPPPPGSNPNDADVVIPLIQEQQLVKRQTLIIPWKNITIVLICIIFSTIIVLYTFRYAKELYLVFIARNHNLRALRALQRLLLMKLTSAGYKHKPPSQTIGEYAEKYEMLGDILMSSDVDG